MSNNIDNYDEQVRKEFEMTQGADETPKKETKKEETVKDLGKVAFDGGLDIKDDPNIKRVNDTLGYQNIPLDTLPSLGRFYPTNTRISICAAKVGEIREFSTIDESDPKNISDKLTYIVSKCTKVYYGNMLGSYRDILEADRIVLLLKIRELTFINGQTSIELDVPEGACQTPGCHPQKKVYFNSSKLEFLKPNPQIEKYYDPVERCYNIQTKRFGVIKLCPPSIGVLTAIESWEESQQKENRNIDVALADIASYVIKDWRGLSEKQVYAKITELSGWSTEKFSLVLNLKELINVGIEYEMTETCTQCGGELKIPIYFPEGYRSLFIPTLSDLGDELL